MFLHPDSYRDGYKAVWVLRVRVKTNCEPVSCQGIVNYLTVLVGSALHRAQRRLDNLPLLSVSGLGLFYSVHLYKSMFCVQIKSPGGTGWKALYTKDNHHLMVQIFIFA